MDRGSETQLQVGEYLAVKGLTPRRGAIEMWFVADKSKVIFLMEISGDLLAICAQQGIGITLVVDGPFATQCFRFIGHKYVI